MSHFRQGRKIFFHNLVLAFSSFLIYLLIGRSLYREESGTKSTTKGRAMNILERTSYSRESFQNKDGFVRKRQVSITSQTGGGKSTLLRQFKTEHWDLFGGNFISAGEIMRGFAAENKMNIGDFAKYCTDNPELDFDARCDRKMYEWADERMRGVGEGRMAHIFMPDAFHVFLHCTLAKRTFRRHLDMKAKSANIKFQKVLEDMDERDKNDNIRLGRKYPGSLWKLEDYDLVIDTGEVYTPHEATLKIIRCQKDWLLGAMPTREKIHA